MENNKLTEFEIGLLNRIKKVTGYGMSDSFIADLRQIMPPTCGKEQRKFLNFIEKTSIEDEIFWIAIGWSDNHDNGGMLIGANFSNSDIPDVDLHKVIKGE